MNRRMTNILIMNENMRKKDKESGIEQERDRFLF